jgi:hypothetical protein
MSSSDKQPAGQSGSQYSVGGVDWARLAPQMPLMNGADYLEMTEEKHRGLGEKLTYRIGLTYLSGYLTVSPFLFLTVLTKLKVLPSVVRTDCLRDCQKRKE